MRKSFFPTSSSDQDKEFQYLVEEPGYTPKSIFYSNYFRKLSKLAKRDHVRHRLDFEEGWRMSWNFLS